MINIYLSFYLSFYLGDTSTRTDKYKNFLTSLLKRKQVDTILDAACGTGVDSIMLLEEVNVSVLL